MLRSSSSSTVVLVAAAAEIGGDKVGFAVRRGG